jgi:hypothetical protein
MQQDKLWTVYLHSFENSGELEKSVKAGCFGCESIFPAKDVCGWIDEGYTALCPHCSTDCVVGDASGFELTDELLKRLHSQYFHTLNAGN